MSLPYSVYCMRLRCTAHFLKFYTVYGPDIVLPPCIVCVPLSLSYPLNWVGRLLLFLCCLHCMSLKTVPSYASSFYLKCLILCSTGFCSVFYVCFFVSPIRLSQCTSDILYFNGRTCKVHFGAVCCGCCSYECRSFLLWLSTFLLFLLLLYPTLFTASPFRIVSCTLTMSLVHVLTCLLDLLCTLLANCLCVCLVSWAAFCLNLTTLAWQHERHLQLTYLLQSKFSDLNIYKPNCWI